MHFGWSTVALQTLNFVVLVWLLHRFLYKPVLRMIDLRRAEVEKQYADARAAETKAEERIAATAAERAGIAAERQALLAAAAAQVEESTKARHVQAEREAAALLDAARKTLATERERALDEARRVALDLGTEFARRLLAEVPAQLRAEGWIERIERHLEALPKAEIEALGRQSAHGHSLTVVTASALSPQAAEAWRSRLRRLLGDSLPVAFDVDANLVAGAELHFPSATLGFSWRRALEAAHAEIGARGHAR